MEKFQSMLLDVAPPTGLGSRRKGFFFMAVTRACPDGGKSRPPLARALWGSAVWFMLFRQLFIGHDICGILVEDELAVVGQTPTAAARRWAPSLLKPDSRVDATAKLLTDS